MPLNWKIYKLGDIGEVVTGKTPSSKYPEHFGDDIPFVTPSDFSNFHKQVARTDRSLSIEGKTVLKKKVLPAKSVLVTCIGSQMGKVVITRKEVVTNQQLNSIIPHLFIDPDYLYYKLLASHDLLRTMAGGGSTMPLLNKGDFETIELNFPPLPEQKVIASILSALDDKIELNLQMNKTLEEMAMALYKHWFVDFGPFQDGEFVDSELGMIPKGWKVETIGDIFKTTSGGTPSRKKSEYYDNGTIPWVKSKELYRDFVIRTEEKITHLGLKKSSAKLLPPKTVLLAMYGATVGESSILSKEAACNQAICAIMEDQISFVYVFQFLRYYKEVILNHAIGSAQQNISQAIIKKIKLVAPPKALRVFNDIKLYYRNIEENLIENQTLTKLRDTLLPKLISGEVRVKEFEKNIVEVL